LDFFFVAAATVDGCEEKAGECIDELTTISTVAAATKRRLPGNAKDLDNDNPHGRFIAIFRLRI
jgi:hypothetical protein